MLSDLENSVVLLKAYFFDQYGKITKEKQGTGFLITCKTLLTARHTLYDSQNVICGKCFAYFKKQEHKQLVFRVEVKKQWKENTDLDIALLELTKTVASVPLGDKLYEAKESELTEVRIINYSKFPKQNGFVNRYLHQIQGHDVRVQEDKKGEKELFYSAETEVGMSGAPVFIENNGELKVVGVHKSRLSKRGDAIATMINDRVIAQISFWSEQLQEEANTLQAKFQQIKHSFEDFSRELQHFLSKDHAKDEPKINEGKQSEQRQQYGKKVDIGASQTSIHLHKGIYWKTKKKNDYSYQEFQLARKHDHSDFRPDYHLGCLLAESGRQSQAVVHFKIACELNPNSFDSCLALARILKKKQKTHEAFKKYEYLVLSDKFDDEVLQEYVYLGGLFKAKQEILDTLTTISRRLSQETSKETIFKVIEQLTRDVQQKDANSAGKSTNESGSKPQNIDISEHQQMQKSSASSYPSSDIPLEEITKQVSNSHSSKKLKKQRSQGEESSLTPFMTEDSPQDTLPPLKIEEMQASVVRLFQNQKQVQSVLQTLKSIRKNEYKMMYLTDQNPSCYKWNLDIVPLNKSVKRPRRTKFLMAIAFNQAPRVLNRSVIMLENLIKEIGLILQWNYPQQWKKITQKLTYYQNQTSRRCLSMLLCHFTSFACRNLTDNSKEFNKLLMKAILFSWQTSDYDYQFTLLIIRRFIGGDLYRAMQILPCFSQIIDRESKSTDDQLETRYKLFFDICDKEDQQRDSTSQQLNYQPIYHFLWDKTCQLFLEGSPKSTTAQQQPQDELTQANAWIKEIKHWIEVPYDQLLLQLKPRARYFSKTIKKLRDHLSSPPKNQIEQLQFFGSEYKEIFRDRSRLNQ